MSIHYNIFISYSFGSVYVRACSESVTPAVVGSVTTPRIASTAKSALTTASSLFQDHQDQ